MKSNVSSAFRALYARLKTVRSKSLSVMLTPILVLNLLPVGLMPGSTEELGNEAGDVAIVSVEETDDLADEQAVEAIPDEQEQSQFTDPELAPMNEPVIEVLDNPPELVDSEDYLTVTYDANGGFTSIVDKGEYEALDTVLVQFSPTPIRDGYEFLGWVDDLSATEVLYALEDDDGETSFVIGDNVTLYAFWDESDFMAIGPLAIGDPHTVTLATGIGSDDPDITYIALEGEKIGDIDDFDASPPTAKAGYAFVGWEPVIDPETVVYNDLVFTAQWIQDFTTPGPSIQHNWSSVLGSPAFGGYQIPGNAQRLDFNDVSNSGQTYLDYAFLVMDNEGNATIIFLTLTRGEDPDYVNYLGINATQKANYTSGNGGNKITYTAWELTLTPAMIATISTGGTLSGTFTYWVGNGGNSINGQTLTFSNLSYTVEHYIYDGVDLGTAVYKLTTPGVGLPGQTVTGNPINIFGYEYDDLASAATKTGTIPPTGGLVLKLYYKPTGTFLWEITGINETIEYDGNEHSLLSVNGGILSDLFQCSFPNDGDYRFEGSLTLVNPVGTDPDTYNQNLYPVIGSYTIWYDGPNKTTGIDGEEDVTDRMGPPQVFNGSLVITQSTAAITIHTPDDTKPYDGTALENHNYTVTGLPNG
ncbi:MAG: InlB B-repeat-containing protein, partial [Coriobacteriia bacterium]|nr:InlB B-repeat-containing protein [Coriobacteriia bacterium]